MTDTRSGIFINTQHRSHTEKGIIAIHRGRLIYADKASPFIYKAGQFFNNSRILPYIPAAPGAARKSGVDHHIHVFQSAV